MQNYTKLIHFTVHWTDLWLRVGRYWISNLALEAQDIDGGLSWSFPFPLSVYEEVPNTEKPVLNGPCIKRNLS